MRLIGGSIISYNETEWRYGCPKCGLVIVSPKVLHGPQIYEKGERSGSVRKTGPTGAAMKDKIQFHRDLCLALNQLYESKNHDYGDSFHETFVEEGMAMPRIRIGDKFRRFKALTSGTEQKVNDESIEDTLMDLANYALMTVVELRRAKGEID